MEKLLTLLSGKKTYIIAIITILIGMYYNNMEMIMLGLTAMGLRDAITKSK